MTEEEKLEAQKYNAELYSLLGIKVKCTTIRDYYLIKSLYLFAKLPMELLESDYYEQLLMIYYNKLGLKIKDKKFINDVIDRTFDGKYFNYGYTEGLYQYYLKYYYNTFLNFTSFLAIYSGDMLPFITLEHTTNAALNKLLKFVEEQSIDMIRHEMSIISNSASDYDLIIQFVWRARHDEKTCQICSDLDNQIFDWAPNLAHPNCRCELEIIVTEV